MADAIGIGNPLLEVRHRDSMKRVCALGYGLEQLSWARFCKRTELNKDAIDKLMLPPTTKLKA